MSPLTREKNRLYEIIVIALLALAVISGYIATESHVIKQAEKRAKLLIMEITAVQRYFHEVIHAKHNELVGNNMIPPGLSNPEILSSEFALQHMVRYYNEELAGHNLPGIHFRIARIKANNPELIADPFEMDLINRFRSGALPSAYREIRLMRDQRILYYAVPLAQYQLPGILVDDPILTDDPGLPLSESYRDETIINQPDQVIGILAVMTPIENDFRLSNLVLWCSMAAVVVIAALMLINIRLDTKVKKSILQLRQSRLEMDLASELTHLGTWTLHLDTMTFTISPEAAALLGNPQFGQGHPSFEQMLVYIHPQDRIDVQNTVQMVLDGESATGIFVYRFLVDGGHYKTFSLNSRLFIDDINQRHLLGNIIEITDQVQVRKERDNLLKNLTARNQELEQYAYSISHDLKTPLITIEGFTYLLKKALDNNDREGIENAIFRLENSAKRLKQLIENLLTLSRLGQIAECKDIVDLNKVVGEALELNDAGIKRIGAKIVIGFLPMITGDSSRLLQVFHNLIDNAIKFMYDQSDPLIAIGTEMRDGSNLIYIRDNGIGVDPESREKIFGLFQKLDRSSEGSGFGLTLVRRIVDAHRGNIWLESEGIGHGTTFYLQFPPQNQGMASE